MFPSFFFILILISQTSLQNELRAGRPKVAGASRETHIFRTILLQQ